MLVKVAHTYNYHKKYTPVVLFAGYRENSNCYCCASFGKCIFHALLRQFPFACQLSAALNVRSRSCKRESGDMAIKNRNAQVNKKKRKKKDETKNDYDNAQNASHRIASHSKRGLHWVFLHGQGSGRFYSVFGIDRRRAIKQKPIFS